MNRTTNILTIILGAVALVALPAPSRGGQPTARVRTLELSLHAYGFATQTVHLQPGPLRIVVNNRSRLRQMHVRVEAAGAALGTAAIRDEVVLRSARRAWSQEVDLPPGEYVLRETTHGLGKCRLIVAAK